MQVKLRLIITFILMYSLIKAQDGLSSRPLIPLPNAISELPGNFKFTDSTMIIASPDLFEAQFLKNKLSVYSGIESDIFPYRGEMNNAINFKRTVDEGENSDHYEIEISVNGVLISAGSDKGFFYAVNTLLQSVQKDKGNVYTIPCGKISDQPVYKWRGMHLDCCRHFFSKEEIKRYIDYLAMYKMNVFHWHLTDDQGWRIEIKKYPLLNTIASQRKETVIAKPVDTRGRPLPGVKYDGKPYGGLYTQDDIREIVAYAKERHIEVVPEIEMPGHSLAALAAYPQFSCTGGPFETYTTWGVAEDVFCAGNDSTFIFLQDVLTEVMELFPSEYIHIGGDECPKKRWKACSKCQKRITDEKLMNEEQLQSYFIARIEKFLNSNNRKIIGWDEILEGGLAPNATVMSWRGMKGGIEAAKQKHNVIMTPGKPCYFDHYQVKDRTKEPLAIGGYNPVDSVYKYDPSPRILSEIERKYILGAQGNVWTEYILNFKQVEYMAIPRMSALAEALWTKPENKHYKKFLSRLSMHSILLDRMKVNYARHVISKVLIELKIL